MRFFITIVSCLAFTLLGCNDSLKAENKRSETKMLMGTIVTVDICKDNHKDEAIDTALEKVWKKMNEVDQRFSTYIEDSDISRINRSQQKVTHVDPQTVFLLRIAVKFYRLTKGAFDISVLPLVELWKKCEKEGRIPSKEEIAEVKKSMGMKKLGLFGKDNVKLYDDNTKLDLDGIAKGHAIGQAASILRNYRFKNFLIDAGGDMHMEGNNCLGKPWRIGIRDPRDNSKIIDVIEVNNMAVATSGDYERYYEINGQKFSHIFNPITGYPVRDVISATVVAPGIVSADVLATALCVLGIERGIELIDSLEDRNIAAMIIEQRTNGEIVQKRSKNYEKFRKSGIK